MSAVTSRLPIGPRFLSQHHLDLAVEAAVAWEAYTAIRDAADAQELEDGVSNWRDQSQEWLLWEVARDALFEFETGYARCEHCRAHVQRTGMRRHQKRTTCICAQNKNRMKAKGWVLTQNVTKGTLQPNKLPGYSDSELVLYYYHQRMYNSPLIRYGWFVPKAEADVVWAAEAARDREEQRAEQLRGNDNENSSTEEKRAGQDG